MLLNNQTKQPKLPDGEYIIIDDNFLSLNDYTIDELIVDSLEYLIVVIKNNEVIHSYLIQSLDK